MSEFWTPEETEAFKKRLQEGKSFGYIARHHGKEIGYRSRCALAGKANRLKLKSKSTTWILGHRKLSDDEVRAIRQSHRTPKEIAAELGVTVDMVQNVQARRTFRNVWVHR